MPLGFGALDATYSQLRSDLRQVRRTIGFAAGIRDFLRERVTVAQAVEEIKKGLELREKNFLEVARTQIYQRPASPYLRLLRLAGCEFGDLQAHTAHHGLEKTLEKLATEGVYFTADEFRGKKEVVRGRESFRVNPRDFMRGPKRGFVSQSSGMRNAPVRYETSLERFAEATFELAVFLSAHNLLNCSHAVYDGILPVSGGVKHLLLYAKAGVPVARWFAYRVPVNSRFERWYHYLTTQLIVLAAKRYQRRFPRPRFTRASAIQQMIDWVVETKRAGRVPCIKTSASNASRIARLAWERGVSLDGAKFIIGGEPFTDAKREVVERSGARAISRYSFNGGGNVGLACVSPLHTDEIHVGEHRLAVIQQPNSATQNGLPIRPLLFTMLSVRETRMHLNVENGDYGVLGGRQCGCALENLGLKLHLHHIRSYEKFTSEGMNYFYGDLFDLFEKILPARFGGGPGDYQLVEEEDRQGQTRLSLIVHPTVGVLDEGRLLSHLRAALAEGSRGNRFMTQLWQDAGTFRVIRKPPHASTRGKILPLHINH